MGQQLKVILFWQKPIKTTDPEYLFIRVISWDDPDESVSDFLLEPDEKMKEWLKAHGDPKLNQYEKGKGAIMRLAKELGRWPEPFEHEFTYVKDLIFNDPIPF